MKYYVLEIFKNAPKSFGKFGNKKRNLKLAEKGLTNGGRFHVFNSAGERERFMEEMKNSDNENTFKITATTALREMGFRLYEKKTTKNTITKLIKHASLYIQKDTL